jgi:hypothetical protein
MAAHVEKHWETGYPIRGACSMENLRDDSSAFVVADLNLRNRGGQQARP